jgi:hypothetical protein
MIAVEFLPRSGSSQWISLPVDATRTEGSIVAFASFGKEVFAPIVKDFLVTARNARSGVSRTSMEHG